MTKSHIIPRMKTFDETHKEKGKSKDRKKILTPGYKIKPIGNIKDLLKNK